MKHTKTLEELKSRGSGKIQPFLGLYNDHIEPIELKGLEGERYPAKELKKLVEKES